MKRIVRSIRSRLKTHLISVRNRRRKVRVGEATPSRTNFLLLMVNFCSLNIRGLNKKPKQASARDLIRAHSLSFVGLVETRVKICKASRITNVINRNWQWIFNYERRVNGRIWLGWDPNLWDVSFVSKTSQFIHCLLLSSELKVQFFVTIVYGFNTPGERKVLWKDLRELAENLDKP